MRSSRVLRTLALVAAAAAVACSTDAASSSAVDAGVTGTPEAAPSATATFAAFGDSRTNSGPHGQVLAAFAPNSPGLVLDLAGYASVLRGMLDKWPPDGKPMVPPFAKAKPTAAERPVILRWFDRRLPNAPTGQ